MRIKEEKQRIREQVWERMESKDIARFPLPCRGRIPNFIGAERAAERLKELREWKVARVVKVNPDSPQRKVRELALKDGKTLVMPSPRLRKGFLILKDLKGVEEEASTIRGAFRFGKEARLEEIPKIDLIVAGSVAVSLDGARVGKGGGYSDIEYGILREVGKVGEDTPVVTTVHEVQILEMVPSERQDLPVDYIITSQRIIRARERKKPKGIYWDLIDEEKLKRIPLLSRLRR